MSRCLRTALNGAGLVAPNPMVGAVLVKDDRILAEGWHRTFGGPHAEVECLQAFGPGPIPEDAALYVNLEPCAHHGKTPPCADLIVARGIRRVVIGGIVSSTLLTLLVLPALYRLIHRDVESTEAMLHG